MPILRVPLLPLLALLISCGEPPRTLSAPEAPGARRTAQALEVLEAPALVDPSPGTADAEVNLLTVVGDTAFFVRSHPTTGARNAVLWKTDGMAEGTVLVKTIYSGPGSNIAFIHEMVAVDGGVFFIVHGADAGKQLWRSDGTEAGTVLLKTINPDSFSLAPSYSLTAAGTQVFLQVPAVGNRSELWKSDSTEAGTVRLKSFPSYWSTPMIAVGERLYFTPDGLWTSDGTEAGTLSLKGLNARELTAMNGAIFFSAGDSSGVELWKSDGTEAGTVLVKDIAPGQASSAPHDLKVLGDTLFFAANDGTSGDELWESDGTVAGTVLRADIAPGSASSRPASLTVKEGKLFFTADHPQYGREPWITAGTTVGTRLVSDLNPGGASSEPAELTAVGSTLFLTADDGTSGRELWKIEGSSHTTSLVKEVRPQAASGRAQALRALGGRLLFLASDGATGLELWISDGTQAGTHLLVDLAQEPASSAPEYLHGEGGSLYYIARGDGVRYGLWKLTSPAGPAELLAPLASEYRNPVLLGSAGGQLLLAVNGTLWRSDGSGPGIEQVKTITSSSSSSGKDRASWGGALFLNAFAPGSGSELWKTDGTEAGTVLVKDISQGSGNGAPDELQALGGALFFSAQDTGAGRELWRTDGTEAGTVRVKDIHPGSGSSSPRYLTAMGGTLFFSAQDDTSGTELWKSDGTEAGTVRVKDISPGSASAFPGQLTAVGGTLFFLADRGLGVELWKSDGTENGTVALKILTRSRGPLQHLLGAVDGTLLFSAEDSTGYVLWKTDGTEAGTVRVKELFPASGGSVLGRAVVLEGMVYFTANDGTSGSELWRSDGTAEGTFQVKDLRPGSASSAPTQLTPLGRVLYFSATDDVNGTELRALPLAPVRCPERVFLEATDAEGAAGASWPAVARAPGASPQLPVSYSPSLGARLPFGDNAVLAIASAPDWPADRCRFTVTVRDTTPPQLSCQEPEPVEAVSASGAPVSYPAATATDAVSAPQVSSSHASGATFPPGETEVIVTATDAADNAATCRFQVKVQDTTPPQLQCPADQVGEVLSSSATLPVSYPAATATDAVSTPTVKYSHPPGSRFPAGETTVSVEARDAAGNTATCSFKVSLQAKPAEAPGGSQGGQGCAATPTGAAPGWVLLILGALWRGERSRMRS